MSETGGKAADVVILGAGVAGYQAAIRAATWGARVVIVEAGELGGTCLNRGCIPTKTLVEDASAVVSARRRGFVSIDSAQPDGRCEHDDKAPHRLAAMIARKNEVVEGLRKGVAALLQKRKVDVVAGRGRLAGPRTVEVDRPDGGKALYTAPGVIVATGSRPGVIPGFEPDGERVFTSDGILDATGVGPRIAIVGGGILGCEFAYVYGALGYDVTVVEMLDRIVPTFSADASREVERALRKLGVNVKAGRRIEGREDGDDGATKLVLAAGEAVEADTVLVAVGRRPNTEDVGLEGLDVLGERGFVLADDGGRTSAHGLYAVGDVNGRCMLAHAAGHQGLAAVAHILGKPAPAEGPVPWCAYTHPEVAQVGMTDAAAADAGRKTLAGRFPFMALGRARAAGDTAGYAKILADAATHRVLGAEIVGLHATELIAEVALAVRLEATLEDVEETIHAHPTMGEGIAEASMAALGRSIHA